MFTRSGLSPNLFKFFIFRLLRLLEGPFQKPIKPSNMSSLKKIDDLGNLTVIVGKGESQIRTLVSKDAMRHASPVWRAMLDTNKWKESTEGVLDMPEDDPQAMLIILRFAHLQFKQIPKVVEPMLLLKIAILCDKYDLYEVLWVHFVPLWTKSEDLKLSPEDTAFCRYAFWQQDKYVKAALKVVERMKINEKNEILHAGGSPLVPTGKEYLNAITRTSQPKIICLIAAQPGY